MKISSDKFKKQITDGEWRFKNGTYYQKRMAIKWERHNILNCRYCGQKFVTKGEDLCCSKSCGRKDFWKNLSFEKRYKRTKWTNEHGYIVIRRKDGTKIAEHRHIMEQILLRPLKRKEHVHHINGKRSDNRPSNLMVLTASGHNVVHKPEQSKKWNRSNLGKFVKKHL